jgi:hypothetical protein
MMVVVRHGGSGSGSVPDFSTGGNWY